MNKKTLISLLLFFGFANNIFALTDAQVKTAYVYNIAKFINWDKETFESEDSPLEICVVTKNDHIKDFDFLENKKVLGHPLKISYFKSSEEINSCHIIYMTGYTKTQIKKELKKIKNKNTLTIGDGYRFSEIGGMVELRLLNEKVKIHVNLEELKRGNCSISSNVLEISTIVKGDKNVR